MSPCGAVQAALGRESLSQQCWNPKSRSCRGKESGYAPVPVLRMRDALAGIILALTAASLTGSACAGGRILAAARAPARFKLCLSGN